MDDFEKVDHWCFSLNTAGQSMFVDFHTNGIQTIGLQEADSLRRWLDGVIEQIKLWEDQQ